MTSREDWDPLVHGELPLELYDEYRGDLYGLLVQLTEGEAKESIKSLAEQDGGIDGFKALWILNRRFDCKTSASLLRPYLEVVNPPKIGDSRHVLKLLMQ